MRLKFAVEKGVGNPYKTGGYGVFGGSGPGVGDGCLAHASVVFIDGKFEIIKKK
jgi:hypothetical protein